MKVSWRSFVPTVAVCAVLAASVAPVPSTAQTARNAGTTFTVAPLGFGADVPNPLRGQYRWLGAEPTPAKVTSNDVYYRDQVYWGRLEKSDNVWDFSAIDAGLADAGARGGKFGFRVMAYCPGCWMESRADFPAVTPSFVPRQEGGYIPDWNSAGFQSQWKELMDELGRRYANDPRLGYVDVGGYGSYGEWHVDAGTQVSDTNGLAIVRAVTAAFPSKHVLINTMTTVPFTLKALAASSNLGLRTDNLGCPDMYSTVPGDLRLQKVWKTRPFFSEWCTGGDPVLGAKQAQQFHISTMSSGNMPWSFESLAATQRSQYAKALATAGYRIQLKTVTLPSSFGPGEKVAVSTVWKNLGTAPAYDVWQARLVFVNAATGASLTKPLGSPLKGLIAKKTRSASISGSGLAKGRYRVYLSVVDPSGYSRPMNLANAGRTAQGAYPVGTVTIR